MFEVDEELSSLIELPAGCFFWEWRCRSVNLLRKSNECTPFTEKSLQTSCNIQMSEHSRNRGCIVSISLRNKTSLQLPLCPRNNFVETVYSGTTNDVIQIVPFHFAIVAMFLTKKTFTSFVFVQRNSDAQQTSLSKFDAAAPLRAEWETPLGASVTTTTRAAMHGPFAELLRLIFFSVDGVSSLRDINWTSNTFKFIKRLHTFLESKKHLISDPFSTCGLRRRLRRDEDRRRNLDGIQATPALQPAVDFLYRG